MNIDEAATELGITLLPWQRELGQAFLDGEQVVIRGGKRSGRVTLAKVITHAQHRNREERP